MIRVLAGQSAQVLHRDDEEWPLPLVGRVQAGVEIEVSALWAISDFRRSNGATNVVVGSHGGHCDPKAAVPPPLAACEAAEMAEGSVLLFTGSVWHGAGASSEGERQGALFQYIPGWLHPEHNLHFAVAPEVSARLDEPELRSLLGFDGSNPFRLNAPGPLYATEYTGYPDREDADFSAPLKPQGQSGYMSRAY